MITKQNINKKKTKEIEQKDNKIEPIYYFIFERYKKCITSFLLIESRISIY